MARCCVPQFSYAASASVRIAENINLLGEQRSGEIFINRASLLPRLPSWAHRRRRANHHMPHEQQLDGFMSGIYMICGDATTGANVTIRVSSAVLSPSEPLVLLADREDQ